MSSLSPLLDKYEQRCFYQTQNLPVPQFSAYEGDGDFAPFSFPLVLKARRHGYDGQGTVIVKSADDLPQALADFADTPLLIEDMELILSSIIPKLFPIFGKLQLEAGVSKI